MCKLKKNKTVEPPIPHLVGDSLFFDLVVVVLVCSGIVVFIYKYCMGHPV